MRSVQWSEFLKICSSGFSWTRTLLLALVAWIVLAQGCVAYLNWHRRDDYHSEQKEARIYNAVIASYEAHSIQDPQDDLSSGQLENTRFVIGLSSAHSQQERVEAYLLAYNKHVLPQGMPEGTVRGLRDDSLSLQERVRMMASVANLEDTTWYHATQAYISGNHARHGSVRPPQRVHAKGADLFGAFVFLLLINIAMVVSFLHKGDGIQWDHVSGRWLWAVPANPGGWLIMLAYAPAFIGMWLVRGIGIVLVAFVQRCILIPGARALAWLGWFLTEADAVKLVTYANQHRQAKREAEHRRLEEITRIGQDVFGFRLELAQARAAAETMTDPAKRAAALAKIDAGERVLAEVADKRLQKSAPAKTSASSKAKGLDDLLIRIEFLHDTDNTLP